MCVAFSEMLASLFPKRKTLGLCSFIGIYKHIGVCKMAGLVDNKIEAGSGCCLGCVVFLSLLVLACAIAYAIIGGYCGA